MHVETNAWGIETAGWAATPGDDCFTLTPADADAALQISGFIREPDADSPADLKKLLAGSVPDGTPLAKVQCGAFAGYGCEYDDPNDGMFSRTWVLERGPVHLFVTFNTPLELKDAHRAVVDWMLSSLTAGADGV